MKNSRLRRIFVLLPVFIFLCIPLSYAEHKSIFFYNPDANLRNISRLKGAMDRYLQKISPELRFQPFLKFNVFLKEVKEKKPDLIIISSLHLPALNDEMNYSPVLIPLDNGKSTYRKLLITKDSGIVKDLSGKRLATTNPGSEGRKMLDLMIFETMKQETDDLGIIWVSKDIDAILALSFGQVDYALISPLNMEILRKSSPMLLNEVNIIANTREIFNSPLCITAYNPSLNLNYTAVVIRGFKEMNNDPEGKKILKMLNYDRWVEIAEEDATKLIGK